MNLCLKWNIYTPACSADTLKIALIDIFKWNLHVGCFPERLSEKIDVGVFFLVVFSRGLESYVREWGSPGHLVETLGGRLQLRVGWGLERSGAGGGIPVPFWIWISPPPLLFLLVLRVSPHTDSQTHTSLSAWVQSYRCCSSRLLGSVQLVMTQCAAATTEAKPACVSALGGLIRALRSRLKSLRQLLRPNQNGVRWEKPGATVLDCCGPKLSSLAVSYSACGA